MCGCGSKTKFKVVLPSGKTMLKNCRAAAELARAKVPGATIVEVKK